MLLYAYWNGHCDDGAMSNERAAPRCGYGRERASNEGPWKRWAGPMKDYAEKEWRFGVWGDGKKKVRSGSMSCLSWEQGKLKL